MVTFSDIKDKAIELYSANDTVRKGLNTAGILTGINLAGNLVTLLTGDNSLNPVFDMAAPVVAMTYADRSIENEDVEKFAAPFLAGIAAYGFGGELANAENYSGALEPVISTMQNGYDGIRSIFGETTNPGVPAGIIGFLGTLATKGVKYFVNRGE